MTQTRRPLPPMSPGLSKWFAEHLEKMVLNRRRHGRSSGSYAQLLEGRDLPPLDVVVPLRPWELIRRHREAEAAQPPT